MPSPEMTNADTRTYYVYKDYGYDTEALIASGSLEFMRMIYAREADDPSDLPCEVCIELAYFTASDEYVAVSRASRETAADDND